MCASELISENQPCIQSFENQEDRNDALNIIKIFNKIELLSIINMFYQLAKWLNEQFPGTSIGKRGWHTKVF